MNMRTCIIALSFTLLIVLVAQGSFSFALYTPSETIASSGSILLSSNFDPKILAVDYSSSWVNDATWIQNNVDVLQIQWYSWQVSQLNQVLAQLKAANPNLIVLIYVDYTLWSPSVDYFGDPTTINSHESWFVHDASGNRLKIDWTSGSYLMDISNTGWRQYLAGWIANTLAANPLLDGVFEDNVWPGFIANAFSQTPYPAIPDATWQQNMINCLTYLKSAIGSKLLMPNAGLGTPYFSNVASGRLIEGWIHPMWWSTTDFGQSEGMQFGLTWEPYNYLTIMQDAKSVVNAGGYFFAMDGCNTNSGSALADVQRVFYYSYSSFLLIANNESCFEFELDNYNIGWRGTYDQTYNLLPLIAVYKQLGNPLGDYYSSSNCLVRDFQNGKVVVNYNSASISFNLGGTYNTINGTSVTTALMGAYTGAIFLKAP